jgi:hypothetical protein
VRDVALHVALVDYVRDEALVCNGGVQVLTRGRSCTRGKQHSARRCARRRPSTTSSRCTINSTPRRRVWPASGHRLRSVADLQRLCLLADDATALDRAALAILDDAVRFGALAAAHPGGRARDLSLAQHRSRCARCARRNVVGLAPAPVSSSDEDEDDAAALETSALALAHAEDDGGPGADRLARMATALDAHVRIVRRGVEALAAGTDDGAETFGVLAFALEDWDR